jgi:membrane protein implicated in regulation of membrane protease activity
MKDFARVLLLLLGVFGLVAGTIYLSYVLGYWGMSLLGIVISTVVILWFIRYFRRK